MVDWGDVDFGGTKARTYTVHTLIIG